MSALMSEAQVAEFMGVTIHAVRKWRAKGIIVYIKVGKTIRFEQEEVEEFLKRHRKNSNTSLTACA